jgi:hypothetical protein
MLFVITTPSANGVLKIGSFTIDKSYYESVSELFSDFFELAADFIVVFC